MVSLVFLATLFLTYALVLEAESSLASMYVQIQYLVETVAAKVLVSRVASGLFFNRILVQFFANSSDLFTPMHTEGATALVSVFEQPRVSAAMDSAVVLPLFKEAAKRKAAPLETHAPMAQTGNRELTRYIHRIHSEVYGLDSPLPSRVCLSNAPDAPDAPDAEQGVMTFTTPSEREVMDKYEIEFFPLMVFTKLDITGFTKFCSSHGAEVVSMLNTLFSAIDNVMDTYAIKGVYKTRTVGDAYEAMRPISAAELAQGSLDTVREAVAAMVEATQEMLHCAQRCFAAAGFSLGVRCGVALGPAFAAILGSERVSYEVFGMAPGRARVMESLSPVGRVCVCSNCHELLKHDRRYKWGSSIQAHSVERSRVSDFLVKGRDLRTQDMNASTQGRRFDAIHGAFTGTEPIGVQSYTDTTLSRAEGTEGTEVVEYVTIDSERERERETEGETIP
ncbi:hypothetical protein KIPB_008762, partial [Kipferlia bialata]|eukprot:g8762.t1